MSRNSPVDVLRAAALRYAGLGLRVVPLRPRDKAPLLRDWPAAASADPATVGRWWDDEPAANVGVALGTGSGVVGIDRDGPHADRLLAEMSGGDLPPTWEFLTPNGNRLLYAIPEGLRPRNVECPIPSGGEVKLMSDGRQTVMPPSVHPTGAAYVWVEGRRPEDLPPAPMPGWLVAEMCSPERPAWADPPTHGPADSFPPGADFNRRGSWDEVLAAAGFTPCKGGRGGTRYFTRPGKAAGVSVSLGHYKAKDGTPALHVFSTQVPGLLADRTYDLFGAWVRLERGGDFEAAARDLALRGFGTPRRDVRHDFPTGGDGANGKPAAPPTAKPAVPPEWDDPVPLDAGVKVPPFPLGALPGDLAALAGTVGAATNSPPDYLAATALAVAAGALGAARVLDVKERYSEISSLYVGVVAPKGSGKTPAASYLMAPLVAEQSRRRKEGDKARAFVENVTTSKLANQMRDNPRGLLMIRDELSALFAGFNEFKAKGQGSDRQFYLSCWSGSPVTKDRVDPDGDDVFVPHPRLSIAGGIQPRILSRFTADSDDGLFDRFLWAYPDPLPMGPENGLTVPASLADAWGEAVDRLWKVDPVDDGRGGQRPFFLRLAAPAWDVWVEWTRWLSDATRADDFPEDLRGPTAKLRGYAARLALVSHALSEAYGEAAPTTVLGAADLARGVELARYFFAHARRVWSAAGRDERTAKARRILAWLSGWTEPTFSRRDLWRDLRKSFTEIEDTIAPLRWLVQLGYLRNVDAPYAGTGRRPTEVYEVHPSLSGNGSQK